MKVWIVERCYDYEGCSIEGVFSTEAAANAYAEKCNTEYGYTSNGPHVVGDWDVDEKAAQQAGAAKGDK